MPVYHYGTLANGRSSDPRRFTANYNLGGFARSFLRRRAGQRGLKSLVVLANEIGKNNINGKMREDFQQVLRSLSPEEAIAFGLSGGLTYKALDLLTRISPDQNLELIAEIRLLTAERHPNGRGETQAGNLLDGIVRQMKEKGDRKEYRLLITLTEILLSRALFLTNGNQRDLRIAVREVKTYAERTRNKALAERAEALLVKLSPQPQAIPVTAPQTKTNGLAPIMGWIEYHLGVPAMRRLLKAGERAGLSDAAIDQKVLLKYPDAIVRHLGPEKFEEMLAALPPEQAAALRQNEIIVASNQEVQEQIDVIDRLLSGANFDLEAAQKFTKGMTRPPSATNIKQLEEKAVQLETRIQSAIEAKEKELREKAAAERRAALKEKTAANREIRSRLNLLKRAANLVDPNKPTAFDPEGAAERLAQAADYKVNPLAEERLQTEYQELLARLQEAVPAAQKQRTQADQKIKAELKAVQAQLNLDKETFDPEAAQAILDKARPQSSNLTAAPAVRKKLKGSLRTLENKITHARQAAEKARARAKKAAEKRAATPPRQKPKAVPAPATAGGTRVRINNIAAALDKLGEDPADEYAWERMLVLGKKLFGNGKTKKKKPSSAKTSKGKKNAQTKARSFFTALALAVPAVSAARAEKLKAAWPAEQVKKLGALYITQGDYEENLAETLALYQSAGRLGSGLSVHRLRKMELIREDLNRLTRLVGSQDWDSLRTEMEKLELELDKAAFVLLKCKLAYPVTRAIASMPPEALPKGPERDLLQDIFFTVRERKAEASLLGQILNKLSVLTARRTGETTRALIDRFAALAPTQKPPDDKTLNFYTCMIAKWFVVFGPEHPQHAIAGAELGKINDLNALKMALATLQKTRHPSIALELGERIRREFPSKIAKDPNFFYLTGMAAFLADKPVLAARYLETSVKLIPNNLAIISLLMLVRLSRGENGQAIKLGKKAVARPGPSEETLPLAFVHSYLAQGYKNSGNYSAARSHHEKALELKPGHITSLMNLCEIYLLEFKRTRDARFLTLARETAEKYVAVASSSSQAHYYLARAYMDEERFEEAEKEIGLAIALARGGKTLTGLQFSRYFYLEGGIHKALGHPAQSAESYINALRYSYSANGLNLAISALTVAGQEIKAATYLNYARAIFPEAEWPKQARQTDSAPPAADLEESKDALGLDRALRTLRPGLMRGEGTSDMFRKLTTLIITLPEDQALEIAELITDSIKSAQGGLIEALSIILPLAREKGANPVLKRLAKSLEKDFHSPKT